MNARILSGAGMLASFVLLTSCFPDYFPRRKLHINLSPTDIAGVWYLRAESARMLQRQYVDVKQEDSFIEFFADGRCQMHKFDDGFNAITGSGTWKIADDDLDDKKSSVMHIAYSTAERSFVSSMYFTRQHGRIILWNWVGDPDSREYVKHERST